MAQFTTKLGLKSPDGTDPFQRQDFVDNYAKLDASPGVYICDSNTRPSTWTSSQAGRQIYVTDWKQFQMWTGTTFINERTAVPCFAGGAVFDASVGKQTTATYTLSTVNTPRPCTLAIIMNITMSVPSESSQFASMRINFDGTDLLMGNYSDAVRFIGNANDPSSDNQQTISALAVVSAAVGSHSIRGKVTTGNWNTTLTVRGLKFLAFMAEYNSSQTM